MSIDIRIERSKQSLSNRWRWRTVASRWATEAGIIMEREVRAKAPVGKKEDSTNGRLRDSINHRTLVSSSSATVSVYTTVPYARYVIHGTPPHLIQPRTASVLRWMENGTYIYRDRVNHPGAKKNPFPEKALLPIVPLLRKSMRDVAISSMEGL